MIILLMSNILIKYLINFLLGDGRTKIKNSKNFIVLKFQTILNILQTIHLKYFCLHTFSSYSHRPMTVFKNNLDRLKKLQDFKNLSDNIKNFNLTVRYLSKVNKEYKIPPYEKYFTKNCF